MEERLRLQCPGARLKNDSATVVRVKNVRERTELPLVQFASERDTSVEAESITEPTGQRTGWGELLEA